MRLEARQTRRGVDVDQNFRKENTRSLPKRAIDKLKIVGIRQPAARLLHVIDRVQLKLLVTTQGSYQPVLRRGVFTGVDPRSCEARWQVIEPHLPADAKTAMDLGCAQGYFCLKLAGRGLTAIGVDTDGAIIDTAWRQARLNDLTGVGFVKDAVSHEFVDRMPEVDVVIFFSLLHHLMYINNIEWCAELLRRLRPKVRKAMFFDMGQSNEPFHEWSALLPNMGPDPGVWLVDFLKANGFTDSKVIGHVPADRMKDVNVKRAVICAR